MSISLVVNVPTEIIALIVLACAGVVIGGRINWLLGIYLSTGGWIISIMLGRIEFSLFLLAPIVLAGVVFAVRNARTLRIPPADQWIIPWLLIWLMWMLILLFIGQRDLGANLRSLVMFEVIPFPFMILFASYHNEIRGFALAYVVGTIVAGLLLFGILRVTAEDIVADPTLANLGLAHLGIANYHWPSYALAISLIFVVGMFQLDQRILVRATLIVLGLIITYFIILLGSRQSIIGTIAAMGVYAVWLYSRRDVPKWSIGLLIVSIVILGILLYQISPSLFLRSDEYTIYDINPASERSAFWRSALDTFLQSPVWGGAYQKDILGHNLFLATLADQGIVGLIYLTGFIVFTLKQAKGLWSSPVSEVTTWSMIVLCVVVFSLVQSQASGDPLSVWALFWGSALLWGRKNRIVIEDTSALGIHRPTLNMNDTHETSNKWGTSS